MSLAQRIATGENPRRSRDAALGRIQDFLDAPPERLHTDLRRSVNRPLSAVIRNFDEVAAAVACTPFAVHLPPEARESGGVTFGAGAGGR